METCLVRDLQVGNVIRLKKRHFKIEQIVVGCDDPKVEVGLRDPTNGNQTVCTFANMKNKVEREQVMTSTPIDTFNHLENVFSFEEKEVNDYLCKNGGNGQALITHIDRQGYTLPPQPEGEQPYPLTTDSFESLPSSAHQYSPRGLESPREVSAPPYTSQFKGFTPASPAEIKPANSNNQPQPQRAPRVSREQFGFGSEKSENNRPARADIDEKEKERSSLLYPDSHQVFVGNLPRSIRDKELKAFFEQYGKVVGLRINMKSDSGEVPNFGFVVFEDPKTVQKVLSAKPILFGGKHRLNVEEKKQHGEDRGRSLGNNQSIGGRGGTRGGMNRGGDRGANQRMGGRGGGRMGNFRLSQ